MSTSYRKFTALDLTDYAQQLPFLTKLKIAQLKLF